MSVQQPEGDEDLWPDFEPFLSAFSIRPLGLDCIACRGIDYDDSTTDHVTLGLSSRTPQSPSASEVDSPRGQMVWTIRTARPNENICGACRGINFESLNAEHTISGVGICKGYRWHENYDDLAESAKTCPICDFLKRDAEAVRDAIASDSRLRLSRRYNVWLRVPDLTVGPPLSHGSRRRHILDIVLIEDEKDHPGRPKVEHSADYLSKNICIGTLAGDIAVSTTSLPCARSPGSTTASTDTFASVYKWLRDCQQTADSSAESTLATIKVTPSRLVKVGKPDTRGPHHHALRLVDTSDLPKETPYATLSYCWGKGEAPWKTLKTNLANRKVSMTDVHLPDTIRDALTIACALKTDYLWIDALCIVQDDDNDWQTEAAKMGETYKRCHFNIAADRGNDSHAGCFNRYSMNQFGDFPPEQCVVASKLKDGSESRLVFYEDITRQKKSSDLQTQWRRGVPGGVLASRTWVCQERLLSPRILHYTDTQLFWECDHCLLAEDDLPVFDSDLDTRRSLRRLMRNESSPIESPKAAQDKWYQDLVESEYSGCKLTYGKDKLIALSGLARAYSAYKKPSTRYLAGLWEDDLCYGLHWYQPLFRTSEPEEYRAPSWSWASHDGRVNYFKYDVIREDSVQIKVSDCEIDLEGADRFGAISHARLDLKGRMISDTLRHKRTWLLERWPPRDASFLVFPDFGGSISSQLPAHVSCMLLSLLVIVEKPVMRWGQSFRGSYAFMLLLRPTYEPGEYTRVGCAYTMNHDTVIALRQEFEGVPIESITLV